MKDFTIASYHNVLQKLYKIIKEIDTNVLIIRYQPEEDEEDISEKNIEEVGVIVKNSLLNFSKVLSNYL